MRRPCAYRFKPPYRWRSVAAEGNAAVRSPAHTLRPDERPGTHRAARPLDREMAFTPGPNTTLSSTLVANGGLPRDALLCLAVPFGWRCCCCCAAAASARSSPLTLASRGAMVLLGAAAMLWMVWQLARRARLTRAGEARSCRSRSGRWRCSSSTSGVFALVISASWIAVDGEWAERWRSCCR